MNKPTRQIRLQFNEPTQGHSLSLDSLSAVDRLGNHLFLGGDESTNIERLSSADGGLTFAQHRLFPVADFIQLPGADEEIDIEGLSYSDNYLWLIGSHSLKRKKAKPTDAPAEQIKDLAHIKSEANRYVLARIPISQNQSTGEVVPCKFCPNPSDANENLTAAHLHYNVPGDALTDAIKNDVHLAPFLAIPGKDNGFDIEGLAARGSRLFIGLRGPVLRGWAVVLEIAVRAQDDTHLALQEIGPQGHLYRKHFLRLDGLGVRDLIWRGDDLLILAGPTMDLDGPVRVFRWRNVVGITEETVTPRDQLSVLLEVPFGAGVDHAEGMAVMAGDHSPAELLIVYDSPAEERKVGKTVVLADQFALPDE
jgi:Protein of unknown function (DUF3616)